MKHILAIFTICCIDLMLTSDSYAQSLDLNDPERAGVRMVACWHHADKHLRTIVDVDKDGLASGIETQLECLTKAIDGKPWTSSTAPVKMGDARVAYRGGWLGASYSMNVEFYSRYACKVSADGNARFERWARAIDVRDDKSPESACYLEEWRLVHVE